MVKGLLGPPAWPSTAVSINVSKVRIKPKDVLRLNECMNRYARIFVTGMTVRIRRIVDRGRVRPK